MKKITPIDLHTKLEKAGIPIDGVSQDGRIDFKDEATDEQKEAAAAILRDYDQEAEDAAKVPDAGDVTDEEIDAAKTVADLKVLLKRMRKGK